MDLYVSGKKFPNAFVSGRDIACDKKSWIFIGAVETRHNFNILITAGNLLPEIKGNESDKETPYTAQIDILKLKIRQELSTNNNRTTGFEVILILTILPVFGTPLF